ncbi:MULTISPECIES: hypothetical protein [unclassified Microcoleus]|uniref:hypothetical protein n=1 Tax=unclassified Microcoleus TaxID=2642155 RepID=UPI002FD459D9
MGHLALVILLSSQLATLPQARGQVAFLLSESTLRQASRKAAFGVNCQLSTANCQLSTLNCQLTTLQLEPILCHD